ncbi:hypothetical protein LINPERHAP2_LOCUS40787, partial [Linum perenne]
KHNVQFFNKQDSQLRLATSRNYEQEKTIYGGNSNETFSFSQGDRNQNQWSDCKGHRQLGNSLKSVSLSPAINADPFMAAPFSLPFPLIVPNP